MSRGLAFRHRPTGKDMHVFDGLWADMMVASVIEYILLKLDQCSLATITPSAHGS